MSPEERVLELARKVYDGRHNLQRVALDPDRLEPEVMIVVGVDYWTELNIYRPKRWQNAPLEIAFEGASGDRVIRLWGLRVERDSDLMPHEARFRSEVRL